MVIQRLSNQMQAAFIQGNLIDAQNMNAFIADLEELTDPEYEALVDEIELTDREQIGLG